MSEAVLERWAETRIPLNRMVIRQERSSLSGDGVYVNKSNLSFACDSSNPGTAKSKKPGQEPFQDECTIDRLLSGQEIASYKGILRSLDRTVPDWKMLATAKCGYVMCKYRSAFGYSVFCSNPRIITTLT